MSIIAVVILVVFLCVMVLFAMVSTTKGKSGCSDDGDCAAHGCSGNEKEEDNNKDQ